jgi:hypothetical protein
MPDETTYTPGSLAWIEHYVGHLFRGMNLNTMSRDIIAERDDHADPV